MIVNNVYKSVDNQQRKPQTAIVRYLIFELSVRCRQLFEIIKTKKPGILTQLTLLIAWYNS